MVNNCITKIIQSTQALCVNKGKIKEFFNIDLRLIERVICCKSSYFMVRKDSLMQESQCINRKSFLL